MNIGQSKVPLLLSAWQWGANAVGTIGFLGFVYCLTSLIFGRVPLSFPLLALSVAMLFAGAYCAMKARKRIENL